MYLDIRLCCFSTCTLLLAIAPGLRAQENPPVPVPPVQGNIPAKTARSESDPIPHVKIGAVLEARPDGILVKSVAPRMPAAEAGWRAGDVIIRIADRQATTPEDMERIFHTYRAGMDVPVLALRNGQDFASKLTMPNDHDPIFLGKPKVPVPDPGIAETVAAVTPLDLGWALGERAGGVWITEVTPKLLAAGAGFRVGDRILAINDRVVAAPATIAEALAAGRPGDVVVFDVERGARRVPIRVTIPAAPLEPNRAFTLNDVVRRLDVQQETLDRILVELEALRTEMRARK